MTSRDDFDVDATTATTTRDDALYNASSCIARFGVVVRVNDARVRAGGMHKP